MCDPVNIALVASVAGSVVSAAGTLVEGQAAADAGEAQQQAYNMAAEQDRRAANYEMANTIRQQQYDRSSRIAQAGASGLALSGSPTEVLVAQAAEDALRIQEIQYGSRIRQNNLRTQGKLADVAGEQAQIGSLFGAGSTLLQGASNAASMAVKMGTSEFAGPSKFQMGNLY